MNQVERLQSLLDTVQRNRERPRDGAGVRPGAPPPVDLAASAAGGSAAAVSLPAPAVLEPTVPEPTVPAAAPSAESQVHVVETQRPPPVSRPRQETERFSGVPSMPVAAVPKDSVSPGFASPESEGQAVPLSEPAGDPASVSRFLSRVPAAQEATFGELLRRSLALRPK